ncbi:MAG: hypothetical protein K6D38_04285, partial [Pseudobutyrivibrio sp.]|nr:hypothetical protein [Pseudobutyrivibrio sp.]
FEDNNIISEEQPVKKSRKGLIIGIIAGLIAIIAIVAVLFFNGTLMPAKMMLGKAVNKGKGEFLEQYKQGYDVIQESCKDVNGDAKFSMKLSLGDKTKQIISSFGIDTSWFNSVQLDMDADVQKEQLGLKINGSVNDTQITSADVVLDSKSEKSYFSCPDVLGDKALSKDMGYQGEQFAKGLEEYSNTYANLADKYPTPEMMDKIVTKYSDVLVNDLKDADVKKSKVDVKAGEVSSKYYQLEIALDTKTVSQVSLDMIEVFEKDEDIKAACEKMVKDQIESGQYGTEYSNFDEFWADIIKGLDEEKTKLNDKLEDIKKDPKNNKQVGSLFAYVDNSFKTDGMRLDFKDENSDEDYSFGFLRTEDGNKAGLKVNAQKDKKDFFLMEGQGEKKNDKFNGEYKVSSDGDDVCTINVEDFELEPYKKSKGKVKVKLGSYAVESAKGSALEVFALAEYVFTFDTQANSTKMDIDVMSGDASLFSLNLAYSLENIDDMSVPTNVADMNSQSDEEVYNLIKSLNLAPVVGNLEKAGVPEQYYQKFKILSDAIASGDDTAIAEALHNFSIANYVEYREE